MKPTVCVTRALLGTRGHATPDHINSVGKELELHDLLGLNTPVHVHVQAGLGHGLLQSLVYGRLSTRQARLDAYYYYRYAFARNIPRLDAESNIYNTTVMLIDNDHVMISFMRRLDTGDDTDDISLTGCHYLLWAWAGLVTDYGTPAAFGQHGERGVFNDQICCGGNTGNAGKLHIVPTTLIMYICMLLITLLY